MAHVEAAGHAGAGHQTNTGIDNRKLMMWLFLGSECLFFGSLIATFLIFANEMTLPPFPHEREVETASLAGLSEPILHLCHEVGDGTMSVCEGILDIPLTSVSTFVLLMSSLAMVLAVYGAQPGWWEVR